MFTKESLCKINLVKQLPCLGILTIQFFLNPYFIISLDDSLETPQQGHLSGEYVKMPSIIL